MHPMADGYNDTIFWRKLFHFLASRYSVNLEFLPPVYTLSDVLNLGFYPLSPKGTDGLELIARGFPTPILGSNAWTSLFQIH